MPTTATTNYATTPTTLQSPQQHHHQLRQLANAIFHGPRYDPFRICERVRERGRKARGEENLQQCLWVFPAFFSAAGVTGRGEAARSRLVDARREAVGVEERPFSRKAAVNFIEIVCV